MLRSLVLLVFVMLSVLLGVLWFGCYMGFAQVPVQQCSVGRPCSVFWTSNPEPDMKDYRLFLRKLPNGFPAEPLLVVVHPQSALGVIAFMGAIGNLVPGQYALAVSARDQALNESPKSLEILFEFVGPDVAPAVPVLTILGVTIP